MPQLRLSLTIPGAVSLGAYEGGALAALITATRALGNDVIVVDSIASASAGSITGLLTARSLLRGVDPVDLMSAAWVDNVSFKAMKTHSTDSPLSSSALSEMASKVFGERGVPDGPEATWQKEPVRLSMAIANLAGLTYTLPDLVGDTTLSASTFLDWYAVTLTNSDGSDAYLKHAEAAIASGSNALGFPAKQLNRMADKERYEQAGLQGFPADGLFWYTDGGTVDNEPLGRTIDLAQGVDSDDERLYLLVHPDPSFPASTPSPVWGGDASLPPWVRTGTHAFSISRSQSIYEDLKRLQKTNSYLEWVKDVAPAVSAGIDQGVADTGLSQQQAAEVRAAVTAALSSALERVRDGRAHVESQANRAPGASPPAGARDVTSTLDSLVREATGLESKAPIKVEVVSPSIDPSVTESPAQQLAGAFLFHFGGFFDVRYRQSDFALGYRNMRYWLTNCLTSYLPDVALEGALKQVDAGYTTLGWDGVRFGGAQLSDLSLGDKVELGNLALHSVHVLSHDVIHGDV